MYTVAVGEGEGDWSRTRIGWGMAEGLDWVVVVSEN